jgi:putative SOS response-associated peptidase YedK
MPVIFKQEAFDEWLDPSNKEPAKIEVYSSTLSA